MKKIISGSKQSYTNFNKEQELSGTVSQKSVESSSSNYPDGPVNKGGKLGAFVSSFFFSGLAPILGVSIGAIIGKLSANRPVTPKQNQVNPGQSAKWSFFGSIPFSLIVLGISIPLLVSTGGGALLPILGISFSFSLFNSLFSALSGYLGAKLYNWLAN